VSERPWWRPGQDDEQGAPLPAVVILEPDYGAELPLISEEEGMLGWRQTGVSPAPGPAGGLAGSLRSWPALRHGGRSPQLQDEWARQARELAAAIRVELGSRAELVAHLWPLGDG
jgi:hypothetical protein